MPISVVIPVYNEEDNVEPLAEEIKSRLEGVVPFEMIFVDDASTDQTNSRLLTLSKKIKNLRIIQHQSNAGQSAALLSGIQSAKYDWIATLDGDGQNDPADIVTMINTLNSLDPKPGTPMVCVGLREKRHDVFIRKISSKIANGVRMFFLKDDCPDTGCGIKLFPKQLFLNLPHFKNCHRFLPALFKRAGAIVINVPVSHRQRLKGKSKYGIHNRLWVGIIDLIGVSWLLRRPINVEHNDVTPSL